MIGAQARTIRICKPRLHIKAEGILMHKWDASSRYLTFWERLAFRWLNCVPSDILPPIETNVYVGSAP